MAYFSSGLQAPSGPLPGLLLARTQLAKETGPGRPPHIPGPSLEVTRRQKPWYLGCLTCSVFHHFLMKEALRCPQPLEPSLPSSGRAAVDTAGPLPRASPGPRASPHLMDPTPHLVFPELSFQNHLPAGPSSGPAPPIVQRPLCLESSSITGRSHEPVACCKVFLTDAVSQGP